MLYKVNNGLKIKGQNLGKNCNPWKAHLHLLRDVCLQFQTVVEISSGTKQGRTILIWQIIMLKYIKWQLYAETHHWTNWLPNVKSTSASTLHDTLRNSARLWLSTEKNGCPRQPILQALLHTQCSFLSVSRGQQSYKMISVIFFLFMIGKTSIIWKLVLNRWTKF